MKKSLNNIFSRVDKRLLVVVVFVGIGFVTLVISRAATPTVHFESETSSLSGNVSTKSDANASSGQYLQFGTTSSSAQLCDGYSNWSNPTTWGGSVPAANSSPTIPAGTKVKVDVDVPHLNGLTVNGELCFPDRATTFSSNFIIVYGKMYVGTESTPIQSNITIKLEGETSPVSRVVAGVDIGSNVMAAASGGTIEIHGKDSGRMRSKLAQSVNAGATSIVLLDAVTWEPGDKIVLSSSSLDYKKFDEATVASRSADGKTITLTAPLVNPHMSVVTSFTSNGETRSVAERTDVGLLTKNIKVSGADNVQTTRFGGHTIVLAGSIMKAENVEMVNLGQEGVLGKYPFHWHITGNALASYAKNTSIHDSVNRFFTVHRTNNLTIDGGVWHNAIGHGFMFEDGVETGNKLNNILAMTIKVPPVGKRLRVSDQVPSEFWITHPTNDLTNIVAAGGEGAGIWYDFNFNSDNTGIFEGIGERLGRVENLEAHSHVGAIEPDFADHANGMGITFDGYYGDTTGGRQFVDNILAWKNDSFGLWMDGKYTARGVYAANNHVGFTAQDTAAAGGLLVGFTANSGSELGHIEGLLRFYHGQADADSIWLAGFDRRAGSHVELAALTDTTASTNDATNRVRNLKFFGTGFKGAFFDYDSNNVDHTHWIEDVDGSILGNGVNALLHNHDRFIKSPLDTILYPNAGTSYWEGSDVGFVRPKTAGVMRFIPSTTLSVTRLDTNETATNTDYAGVNMSQRYRINNSPADVSFQVRGSEPGWIEIEFPNSNAPVGVSGLGGAVRQASSEADLATGGNGGWYYNSGTRLLVVRIVIKGTPIPFGNGGDYATIQGDWTDWDINR